MKILKRTKNWHSKYGVKAFRSLSPTYVPVLQTNAKYGRKIYLTRSKRKAKKWREAHPELNRFKTFKAMVLSKKRSNPFLESLFKGLFLYVGSKGAYKYKHLSARKLFDKMIELNGKEKA